MLEVRLKQVVQDLLVAPPFIEMPAHDESSTTIPSQMALLRHDLDLLDAQDPETRLRIFSILGMFEVNYDSRWHYRPGQK
jgi:hypothetical protein